jgi:hypothetical protein
MKLTEYIPREKFNLWIGLFKGYSGRFLRDPFVMFDSVEVVYTFNDYDDYLKFGSEWRRLNAPIVETRRGFWKKLKRKLGIKK